jgi:selenide,water dikinase
VRGLPRFDDPNLLVGAEHFSDAGVYRIAENTALVQSLDFFSPLVDDPFIFGQIAAANSLSDVYAMGGTPLTALSLVCYPDDELELEPLNQILRGAADRVLQAGAVIVGGHSIRDAQIVYGLSVTGTVDPGHFMRNDAATPGDVLLLTKPLGTGFITTALRKNKCPDDVIAAACASMIQLNRDAAAAAMATGCLAATDVTGFGLGGHARELADASGVTLEIDAAALPWLPGGRDLALAGFNTRANATNKASLEAAGIELPGDTATAAMIVDPQTSGGLLLSIPADAASDFVARCADADVQAVIIGRAVERESAALRFV